MAAAFGSSGLGPLTTRPQREWFCPKTTSVVQIIAIDGLIEDNGAKHPCAPGKGGAPGPWEHDTTGQSRFMVCPSTDPDNSTVIATGIENEATARLIAAAQSPDRPRPMEGEKVL
jgi:hypothetical protein